jgi:hypothetical protein
MEPRLASLFFPLPAGKVELVLRLPDGAPWTLSVSPGIERFIGYYPRLDGIDPGGPLLEYTRLQGN